MLKLILLFIAVLISGAYYILAHMEGEVNIKYAVFFYGSTIWLIYELIKLG